MAEVMRGTVTKMSARKPHVEVADLGVGYDFGPCETATGADLQRGDRVLVVSVGGITEDVVVIDKLDPDTDFSRLEVYFDVRYYRRSLVDSALAALDARITSEVATLNSRITSEVAALNSRITSEVATLNARITTEAAASVSRDNGLQASITALTTRVTDLEAHTTHPPVE